MLTGLEIARQTLKRLSAMKSSARSPALETLAKTVVDLDAQVQAQSQQIETLRDALKGSRLLARPWIDGVIGRAGTVTYGDWQAAYDAIEQALTEVK